MFNPNTIKCTSARGYIVLIILNKYIDQFKRFNSYCHQRFSLNVALTFRLKSLFLFNLPDVSHYNDNISNLVLGFSNLIL